jgi:hypothetical protein
MLYGKWHPKEIKRSLLEQSDRQRLCNATTQSPALPAALTQQPTTALHAVIAPVFSTTRKVLADSLRKPPPKNKIKQNQSHRLHSAR